MMFDLFIYAVIFGLGVLLGYNHQRAQEIKEEIIWKLKARSGNKWDKF